MSSDRSIKKFKKYIIRKLDKWNLKGKFRGVYEKIILIINQSCDDLVKEGLMFNINLSQYKELFVNELERICFKLEKGENVERFDVFFIYNSFNNDNEELFELEKHKKALNSEIYRPMLESMYNGKNMGQPPTDPVLIFNVMYLQAKYDLSDEQVIKDIKDRDSFQYFLDFPEKIPAKSTLGDFRNRLIKYDCVDKIWFRHQKYLDFIGYYLTRELAIDAAFLDSNPGVYGKPRNELAKTRRIKDGTFMTKNDERHFGFKNHMVIDLKFQLIRKFLVTTASVHDSQVTFDFIESYIMYADKGYVGADFECYKAYMLRKSNNPQINANRQHRNLRISRKRAPVERVFAVFDEHGQNFTKLTTVARNQVKILFASLLFNVKQILTLENPKKKEKNKNSEENDYLVLFNFLDNIPKMIEIRERIDVLKKRRLKRVKYRWKKFNKLFKKPKQKKKSKKKAQESQKPNKKFNRKLAHSF